MAEHNYTDTAIGIGAGYAVKKYSEQILKKPYSIYLKDYRKKFFNDAENQIFKQKGFETFTKLGLDKQGITLIDINPANCANYLTTKKLRTASRLFFIPQQKV